MEAHLEATFDVENWEETPFDDGGGAKVTRALVAKRYSGHVEGTSTTQWLMAYAEDGSATFVGLERVTGTLGGREGTVVLQHVGSYADGAARGELTVVDGSGSGALQSATGAGRFVADPSGSVSLDLSFD